MIIVPKNILHKALMYASLYGPSSQEPAKHSLIGAVRLHIEDGKLQIYTKLYPVMSSMAHLTILDDNIKGKGEVLIGEVCKVIGGRDSDGISWKSVWERLADPVTLKINKNTVIFNNDQSYELSISLTKGSIGDNTNIQPDIFLKRISIERNTDYLLKDSKNIGSMFRIKGEDLKSITDDEKGMPSDYFEFSVTKDVQTVLSMKLGNSSRSSKRKIDLLHVDLDMGSIEARFFNGIEAFANAIIADEPIDIYYDNHQNKFTLFQNVRGIQMTYLEAGATIDV